MNLNHSILIYNMILRIYYVRLHVHVHVYGFVPEINLFVFVPATDNNEAEMRRMLR